MPEIHAQSVREWGRLAVAHVDATEHWELTYFFTDVVSSGGSLVYRVGCRVCDQWFTITHETLAHDPDGSVLESAFQTPAGRENILAAIRNVSHLQVPTAPDFSTVNLVTQWTTLPTGGAAPTYFRKVHLGGAPEPELPRRTAWSRLLDDEPPV
jgi:hypothetical protein